MDHSYALEIPNGWIQHALQRWPNDLDLTVNGLSLERIRVLKYPANNAFPKTHKAAKADMLTIDLAELTIAELKVSEHQSALTVLENTPANIAGKAAFRLLYTQKDADGLLRRTLLYGALHKGNFYVLLYSAPQLHYFDKYLSDFQQLFSSFRFS